MRRSVEIIGTINSNTSWELFMYFGRYFFEALCLSRTLYKSLTPGFVCSTLNVEPGYGGTKVGGVKPRAPVFGFGGNVEVARLPRFDISVGSVDWNVSSICTLSLSANKFGLTEGFFGVFPAFSRIFCVSGFKFVILGAQNPL
jgi:hypothetical protein